MPEEKKLDPRTDLSELWDESDHAAPVPGEKHKLYELDGLPVRFSGKPTQFPERWNPKTKAWEPYTQLTNVAFNGTPLEKAEFKELCKKVGATEK